MKHSLSSGQYKFNEEQWTKDIWHTWFWGFWNVGMEVEQLIINDKAILKAMCIIPYCLCREFAYKYSSDLIYMIAYILFQRMAVKIAFSETETFINNLYQVIHSCWTILFPRKKDNVKLDECQSKSNYTKIIKQKQRSADWRMTDNYTI